MAFLLSSQVILRLLAQRAQFKNLGSRAVILQVWATGYCSQSVIEIKYRNEE